MHLSNLSQKIDQHFLLLNEHHLGTTTGFFKRAARKLSPLILLKAFCMISCQNAVSYTQIAILISIIKNSTVSKQAVAKRIAKPMVAFCKSTLATLLSNQALLPFSPIPLFAAFNRVLVQDSTALQLPLQLATQYPGPRNWCNIQYATAKIQTIIDLKQNSFLHFQLTPFIKNDQSSAGDILNILKPGDLIIRDLGYFVIPVFKKIINCQAFFISRLKYNSALFDKTMKRFDILDRLNTSGSLDEWVYLGVHDKLRVRIVAIPLEKSIADERRRKLKHNRDRRMNPSKAHLDLCSWAIFVTNVSEDVWSAQQIKDIYRLRWRIEIIFKSWKSHFKLNQPVWPSNEHFTETIIYTRLIYILIFNTSFFVPMLCESQKKQGPNVSLLKLSNMIAQNISFLNNIQDSRFVLELIMYFCHYEKRKDRKNYYDLLN